MRDVELIVKVDARFEWMTPPDGVHDSMLRDQANLKLRAHSAKINLAVKLILLEMIDFDASSNA